MREKHSSALPVLDRVVCMAAGPFLGWLPPRVQRDIVIDEDGFGHDRATLLSKSSRAVGAACTLYAVAAAAAKPFGADIDPTQGNYLIWGSVGVGIDAIARELCRGAAITYHGDSAAGDIWGSPTASIVDRVLHPKAYAIESSRQSP